MEMEVKKNKNKNKNKKIKKKKPADQPGLFSYWIYHFIDYIIH